MVALGFVGLKFVLPLYLMYGRGFGVETPFPRRFCKSYPRVAAGLFVLGGPVLFAVLIATGIWLLKR
jgi:hypothetical protein